MSKKSRYLVKRATGLSNPFVAIKKLTNIGFSILYLNSPDSPATFSTVPIVM